MKKGVVHMDGKTKKWWRAAAVRAVRTMAQTAVLTAVDWPVVASASVLAGVLSLLTSLAGLPEVEA